MPHPRPLLGRQEPLGGGTEELPRRLRVRGHRVRDVDHRFDLGQCLVQSRSSGNIHAPGAGNHDDFVPLPLQRIDRIPAYEASTTCDCYTHFLHSFVGSLIVRFHSTATRGPTQIGPTTAKRCLRAVAKRRLAVDSFLLRGQRVGLLFVSSLPHRVSFVWTAIVALCSRFRGVWRSVSFASCYSTEQPPRSLSQRSGRGEGPSSRSKKCTSRTWALAMTARQWCRLYCPGAPASGASMAPSSDTNSVTTIRAAISRSPLLQLVAYRLPFSSAFGPETPPTPGGTRPITDRRPRG